MFMDIFHHFGGEQEGVETALRSETRIAIAETDHARYPVGIGQGQHNRANHVVQPRTKPTTRDNTTGESGWIKKDMGSRTGQFEGGRGLPSLPKRL